jgi:hypothetical protein
MIADAHHKLQIMKMAFLNLRKQTLKRNKGINVPFAKGSPIQLYQIFK